MSAHSFRRRGGGGVGLHKCKNKRTVRRPAYLHSEQRAKRMEVPVAGVNILAPDPAGERISWSRRGDQLFQGRDDGRVFIHILFRQRLNHPARYKIYRSSKPYGYVIFIWYNPARRPLSCILGIGYLNFPLHRLTDPSLSSVVDPDPQTSASFGNVDPHRIPIK